MKFPYQILMIIYFTATQINLGAVDLDSLRYYVKIDSLVSLSDKNYENGDLSGCIAERQNAVQLLKEIQDWKKLVLEFNTLNVAYNLADDIDGSYASLDSALVYSEKYLSNTDVEFLYTVSNLGFREYLLTNYSKSIYYWEKALKAFEKNDTPVEDCFNTVELLISTYRNKGEFDLSQKLAFKYYNQVDSLEKSFFFKSKILLNIGLNYFQNSEFENAIETFNQTLTFIEKIDNSQDKINIHIDCTTALANAYSEIDSIAESTDLFNSIDISKASGGQLITDYYYHLGVNYLRLKEYRKAINNFNYAYNLSSSKEIQIEKVLSNYSSYLCESYLKNSQIDSAQYFAKKALMHLGMPDSIFLNEYSDFLELANFNINNVRTHSRVAGVYLEKYRHSKDAVVKHEVLKNYRQAFNGAKFLQKELSSKHSKYILNKNLQEHYPAYFSLLLEIYNEENSQETFQEILQLIEDNKAVVLKEDVQEKLALMSSQIPEELLDKDIEFKEELNTLKRKIHDFKPKNEEDEAVVNKWKEEQLQVTRDYSDHQKYLEDNYPEYFKTKYEIQTINLQDLRDELDGDQAFLSFYQTEENWYCAWVTKESEGIHTVGKPENVKNDLEEVLRILRNNPLDNFQASDRNDFKSSAYNLYGELIPKELETKSSFIISQIGELNYLPFEVLLTSDKTEDLGFSDLPYLIKDKEIQYASSAELWLSSKKTKSKNLELAAVSFAPFTEGAATDQRNCVADAKMSALACTKKELDYISDHVTSKSYFSQDASLANFETMDAASIIHLATHACLDDADDAFNKLIFYDDYLSIQDLESMRLNADLAVLSACNTGSGQMKAGEGVIHLGKAFRAAGVSSLITSLWSINDCATADIVGNFYGHLGKENISTALRRAKLDYLKDSNKLLAHPHFWAGLTFSGNAEVLSKDNSLGFLVPIIACLAVILAFFFFRRRN